MGQCSSSSKHNRSKQGCQKQYEAALEDEDDTGIVAPQGEVSAESCRRGARRALDGSANSDPKATAGATSFGAKEASARQVEEYNLAALRPSVDDTTCTALLALRMGRGSSVGGLMNNTQSSIELRTAGPSTEVNAMDPLPEETAMQADGDSGTIDLARGDPSTRQPQENHQRNQQQAGGPPGQQPPLPKQFSRMDSSDHLVALMMSGGDTARAPVLPTRA